MNRFVHCFAGEQQERRSKMMMRSHKAQRVICLAERSNKYHKMNSNGPNYNNLTILNLFELLHLKVV